MFLVPSGRGDEHDSGASAVGVGGICNVLQPSRVSTSTLPEKRLMRAVYVELPMWTSPVDHAVGQTNAPNNMTAPITATSAGFLIQNLVHKVRPVRVISQGGTGA